MPKTTRYDKLARLIRRDFERAKTFTNSSLTANEAEILVESLREGWRKDNEKFANFRPYNAISVDNDSTTGIRVYLSEQQSWYFDVGANQSRRLEVPVYFTYVEIEEQDGNTVSADDIQVTVAKHIDSREMDLLKMSGMLDVQ